MKQKDKAIIRNMSETERIKSVREVREKIAGIMYDRFSKQLKNVRETKSLRTKLAILLTIQKEKELTHE